MQLDDIKINIYKNQDLKYQKFIFKSIPNTNSQIIGVRVPILRKIAKEIEKNSLVEKFLEQPNKKYHEEKLIQAFLISNINDYKRVLIELKKFLPYTNNWAVSDSITPKIFKNNKDILIREIKSWISSEHIYTKRFGIKMLMTHYLEKDTFKDEYLDLVSEINSKDYYIKMMIAWFFSTAFIKQWDKSIKYIENQKLEKWIHNKSIQKGVESLVINDDKKQYLKSFKR